MEKPKVPSTVQLLGQAFQGPNYPPGEYIVKIIKNKDTIEGSIHVEYDENPHHSVADRDEKYKYLMQAYNMLEDMAYLNNQIIEIRDQSSAKADSVKTSLNKKLTELSGSMEDLRKDMMATRIGRITGEKRLREKIGEIYGGIMSYQGKPTQSQIDGLAQLQIQMKVYEDEIENATTEVLPDINKKLQKSGISEISLTDKETFLAEKQ